MKHLVRKIKIKGFGHSLDKKTSPSFQYKWIRGEEFYQTQDRKEGLNMLHMREASNLATTQRNLTQNLQISQIEALVTKCKSPRESI